MTTKMTIETLTQVSAKPDATKFDSFVKRVFNKHCPKNKIIRDEAGNYYTYFPPLPWWLSFLIRVQIWIS